jgi:glycosyltransferase involved in cell wall biosynthesis
MMKQVLFLPSWYPTRNNPLAGDFIQRYALSVSLVNKVCVFFYEKDLSINAPELVIKEVNENLTEYIYYYPESKIPVPFIKRSISTITRFRLLRRLYARVFGKSKPDMIHVHVAYHGGEFALFLKWTKKTAYVLSEHHGQYMPEFNRVEQLSFAEKNITRLVYKHALMVHTVSASLGESLAAKQLVRQKPVVIPNVVDTELFYFLPRAKSPVARFVHVSMLTHQKNPDGMLRAFAMVRDKGYDFMLHIAGSVSPALLELRQVLGLQEKVLFYGEIPYTEVAKITRGSDAMVFFTRFETFGCVIAEALCAGLPVLLSDLPVTHETIREGVNGSFVPSEDEEALAGAITRFIEGGYHFDSRQIADAAAEKYSYLQGGRLMDEFYTKAIHALEQKGH